MITIKNEWNEDFQLRHLVDLAAPGCRILDSMPEPEIIKPGQTLAIVGYEPGVRYVLEPVKRRDIPRQFDTRGGDPYSRIGAKAFT